jgi:uncharacterized protein YfeS
MFTVSIIGGSTDRATYPIVYQAVAAKIMTRLSSNNYVAGSLTVFVNLFENHAEPTEREIQEFGHSAKVVWRHGKRDLELTFTSMCINAPTAFRNDVPDISQVRAAQQELRSVLESLRSKIEKKLGSYGALLVIDLDAALSGEISDQEELKQLLESRFEGNDRDVVDKSGAHPRAIELLEEDFYWSEGDDCSPHGNDYGIQVWEDYRERRVRFGKAAVKFLDAIIEEFGVEQDPENRFLMTWAVAFAELKTHGKIGNLIQERFRSDAAEALKLPKAHADWYDNIRSSLRVFERLDRS